MRRGGGAGAVAAAVAVAAAAAALLLMLMLIGVLTPRTPQPRQQQQQQQQRNEETPREQEGDEAAYFDAAAEEFAAALGDYPRVRREELRRCLRDKTVVVLGDSTSGETMVDLVLMVAGVTSRDEINAYMTRSGTFPFPEPGTRTSSLSGSASAGQTMVLEGGTVQTPVTLEFLHGNRIMRASAPAWRWNATFRFTGHFDVRENLLGAGALLNDELWTSELGALVASADVVLVNSGAHDCVAQEHQPQPGWLRTYEEALSKGLERVRRGATKPRAKVWFRGTTFEVTARPQCGALNRAARAACAASGVPFVDVQPLVRPLYRMLPHVPDVVGLHAGAVLVSSRTAQLGKPSELSGPTASLLQTRVLVRAVCGL